MNPHLTQKRVVGDMVEPLVHGQAAGHRKCDVAGCGSADVPKIVQGVAKWSAEAAHCECVVAVHGVAGCGSADVSKIVQGVAKW